MGSYAPRRVRIDTARGTLERLDPGEFISVESLDAEGWRATGEPEFYLNDRRITEAEARAICDTELQAST